MDFINPQYLINALVFSVVGVSVFWLSFIIIDKFTPYSLWKEIVEDFPDVTEEDIRAQKTNGIAGDFYDGFVSVNLLDFKTGMAIDFFVSNECFATVYARLPFPGAQAPDDDATKYFALFKEQPLPNGPQQTHRYKITYNQSSNELLFYVEGQLVNHEVNVPKMESFIAALGLMTEKDIVDGKSVSCHGQGINAEWSPLTITKVHAG